jgi:hypothetical protein
VGLTANTGTAVALYRFVDRPNQFADLGGGFRSWGFDANVALFPGLLAGAVTNQKAGWGDPLIAGRYHYDFGNGFGATAYGDIGGFGLGAHTDWQVMGTVDYSLNSWISLRAGYRSLNFSYTTEIGSVGFNVHMRGRSSPAPSDFDRRVRCRFAPDAAAHTRLYKFRWSSSAAFPSGNQAMDLTVLPKMHRLRLVS